MRLSIFLCLFLWSVAHAEYNDKLCKQRAVLKNKTAPLISGPYSFDKRKCENNSLVMYIHFLDESYLKVAALKEEIRKGVCESDPSPWVYTDSVVNKFSSLRGKPLFDVIVNKTDCK